MTRQLLIVLSVWVAGLGATSMRRIAQIPAGPYHGSHGRVVCCDSDHDSLPEMYFFDNDSACHQIWEFQGWNQFDFVFEDTALQLPFIRARTAIPFAAGDIDGDGLTDVVCVTVEYDSTNPNVVYDDVITIESRDSLSYPCSLSWYYRCGNNFAIPFLTRYLPDMDEDGRKEIFSATPGLGTCIWENTGNDQNQLVWRDVTHAFSCMTVGDFDEDGKMDFASASAGSAGITSVWECTGDDQYEVVYQDTVGQPNGTDAFMTNDIDGDSLPEFYVAYENVPRGKIYLYMWEMTGDDEYARVLVDSVGFSGTDWGRVSECGDIDGDGVDECIWTTPDVIRMYKVVGNLMPQEVWHWDNDHGGFRSLVSTVYDINNDGYNELITAGNAKISIFEIDAVDLLSPNGGSCSVGDTVEIRWRANTPPTCDSLSLFLRRDSLWHLSTIATGLPGADTAYRWVVPSGVPETARVVVVAYGQASGHDPKSQEDLGHVPWQWDISDSVITFIGGGVAEGTHNVPLRWSLSVSPNPARGAFSVRYDVPGSLGTRSALSDNSVMSLGVYDAGGRLVRSLSDGEVSPGRHETRLSSGVLPAGVYFVRLEPTAISRQPLAVTKLVLQK